MGRGDICKHHTATTNGTGKEGELQLGSAQGSDRMRHWWDNFVPNSTNAGAGKKRRG